MAEAAFAEVWEAASGADDPVQLQRVVVLSAITEAIREKGVDASPTAYYGALMASLTAQRTGGESDTTVAGATYLLALLLPHLPHSLLRAQAGDAAAVLLACQKNYADSSLVARQVLSCLPPMLAVQSEAAWGQITATKGGHSLSQPWQVLLATMGDSRPKVRKAAQAAVLKALADCPSAAAGASAASYCAKALRAGAGSSGKKERGKASAAIAAAISFLRPGVSRLHEEDVLRVIEPLLRVCQLGDPHAANGAIEVLQQVVLPGAAAELSASHLIAFQRSLLGISVGTLDASCAAGFSELLAAVLVRAFTISEAEACTFIAEVWGRIQVNVQSDCDIDTVRASVGALKQLVESCVRPQEHRSPGTLDYGPSLVNLCADLLRYKYKAWWTETMPVLAELLIQLGSSVGDEVDELLQSVATMCGSADGTGLEEEQLRALRLVLGAAVTSIGPVRFVSIVPLDETAILGQNASWIVASLRSNIRRAELGFFSDYVIPFVERLGLREPAATAEEKFRITQLELGMWGLVVPLCSTRPTDVPATFKAVAKQLGDALRTKKSLRTTVCSALTALIRNSRKDAASSGPAAAEGQQNLNEMAKFDKNFLPILFNIFGDTSGGGESDAVVGTIAAYASIADPHRLNTFFKTIMKKLLESISGAETGDSRDRHVMTDLALALAGSLSQENLGLLYRCVRPQLVHTDATLQKKSYKVVLFLLGGSSREENLGDEGHGTTAAAFADDRTVLMDICEALASSTQSCQAAARPLRHKCLELSIRRIDNDELASFAQVFLGEAILATKEPNVKARDAAIAVISGLASRMVEISALPQYMAMLAAGLAGKSSHMIIASVGCMTQTLGDYHETHGIEQEFASMLLGNVALLMHHTTPGVVKAALGFLKVATQAFDPETLTRHLQELIPGLLKWIRESNETRLKIRYLLHRFIRKLGQELVFANVPTTHHKLLLNICKMHQNAKKLKKKDKPEKGREKDPLESLWSDSDSDSDELEMDDVGAADKSSAEASNASHGRGARDARVSWLHEAQSTGSSADPLDLLGSSAARHVSFQNPQNLAKAARQSAKLHARFETREGRIVVPDEPDPNKKRSRDEDEDEAAERAAQEDDDADSADERLAPAQNKRQKTPFQSGAEQFRSARAAGDVKRGGVDPYAYLPLDRRQLQRRQNKRGDVVQRYDGLVKGAQKGAKAARGKARR
jgi:ribosomal RNA-processing protein 12